MMVCLVSYCDRNKQEARSGCMKWVHPSTHLLAPTGLSGTGKIECKEQSHSRSPRKRKQLRQRLWSVHNELASSPAHFGRHLMGKWRPEVGWDYIYTSRLPVGQDGVMVLTRCWFVYSLLLRIERRKLLFGTSGVAE